MRIRGPVPGPGTTAQVSVLRRRGWAGIHQIEENPCHKDGGAAGQGEEWNTEQPQLQSCSTQSRSVGTQRAGAEWPAGSCHHASWPHAAGAAPVAVAAAAAAALRLLQLHLLLRLHLRRLLLRLPLPWPGSRHKTGWPCRCCSRCSLAGGHVRRQQPVLLQARANYCLQLSRGAGTSSASRQEAGGAAEAGERVAGKCPACLPGSLITGARESAPWRALLPQRSLNIARNLRLESLEEEQNTTQQQATSA